MSGRVTIQRFYWVCIHHLKTISLILCVCELHVMIWQHCLCGALDECCLISGG